MENFIIALRSLLENWAAIAVSFTTICGILYGGYRWFRKYWASTLRVKMLNSINHFVTDLPISKQFATLENFVTAELKPNHGSSLRDAIDRIEEKLAFLKVMHDLVSDKMDMSYWIVDKSGESVYTSKSLLNLLEIQSTEMVGFGWKSFVDNGETQDFTDLLKSSIVDKREFRTVVELMKNNGEKISVNIHAYPFFNSRKNLLGYVITAKPD